MAARFFSFLKAAHPKALFEANNRMWYRMTQKTHDQMQAGSITPLYKASFFILLANYFIEWNGIESKYEPYLKM
jgi:hypothetical protein